MKNIDLHVKTLPQKCDSDNEEISVRKVHVV